MFALQPDGRVTGSTLQPEGAFGLRFSTDEILTDVAVSVVGLSSLVAAKLAASR